eukprot:1790915-Pleurochrysis_carterae.AAC.1
MYALVRQEFGELLREEFAGVVTVQRPHHTGRCVASFVEQSCETGQEPPNVHGLEPSVVVDDYQSVAASTIYGWKKGSGDVHVDQPPR